MNSFAASFVVVFAVVNVGIAFWCWRAPYSKVSVYYVVISALVQWMLFVGMIMFAGIALSKGHALNYRYGVMATSTVLSGYFYARWLVGYRFVQALNKEVAELATKYDMEEKVVRAVMQANGGTFPTTAFDRVYNMILTDRTMTYEEKTKELMNQWYMLVSQYLRGTRTLLAKSSAIQAFREPV